MSDALFPFPDDSPLGRATRDPVAALALLAEAVSRGEKNIENYLIAANAAIGHVRDNGLILLPEGSLWHHIPGHDTLKEERVVGGSDFPDRTYYRDTLICRKCGWRGEDFGDAQKLLLSHLIHALSGALSE